MPSDPFPSPSAGSSSGGKSRLLSVVAPAFNEEAVIAQFCDRTLASLGNIPGWELELLIVDDGSNDNTANIVRQLRQRDPRVGLVSFSRNFGHEAALLAGLDRARGDATAIVDADLQTPPEVVREMLRKLDEGFDIVNGRRSRERDSEGFFKRVTAAVWYRLLPLFSRGDPTPPADVNNFRLVSRRALDAFLQLRESGRYARGLFAWIGFPAAEVEYQRAPRAAGETKYPLRKMIGLALDGLTSFSTAPLRWSVYLGFFALALALACFVFVFYVTFVLRAGIPGWASILASVLVLGGVQLVMLGIIGEYLAGVFSESKRRPLYIVREFLPAEVGTDSGVGFDSQASGTGSRRSGAGSDVVSQKINGPDGTERKTQ